MQILKKILILNLLYSTSSFSRDYIIYSIMQSISMGTANEKVKKNYYLNMGNTQGLENGTIIDVYRNISRVDPYASKKRYNYNVKIGELKVVHSQDQSSIASLNKVIVNEERPLFDIEGFMIGDVVKVSVK